MESKPRILTGVFPFTGAGLQQAVPLAGLSYTVPSDKRSQLLYFRGGNSANEMVAVSLMRDGKPFRVFPIGAKAGVHIPLVVVEDLFPENTVQVVVAAPQGVTGEVVLDIGLMEI